MLYPARILSLSLSVSLVALMAAPASAQMRTTAPRAQAAQAPVTPAAPTLSAFRRTGLEFRLFGGAQWQHGHTVNYGSQVFTNAGSITTTQTPAGGAPGAGVPAQSGTTTNPSGSLLTSPIASTSAAIPGMGLTFGGELSYWLNDTFGLGLGYQWMGNGASATATGRMLPSSGGPTLAIATGSLTPAASGSTQVVTAAASGSTLAWLQPASGISWQVMTDNNPIYQTVTGGGLVAVNRSAMAVNFLPGTLAFTPARSNFGGSPVVASTAGGTTAFTTASGTFLSTGPIPDNPNAAAGATPTTTYTADARVDFKGSDDRSLSAWDLLSKTVLFDNGATELTLLSGLTAPSIWARQTSTVRLTSESGSGAATQTVTRTDPTTGNGNTNYTETTTINYAATSSIDASATMYGPMLGIGARAIVMPNLQVYSRFGWSPLLIGTGGYNQTVAQKGDRTAVLSNVGGTAPAGFTSTVTTNGGNFVTGSRVSGEVNSTNGNQGSLPSVVLNASGASTLAVIGARYGLTPNVGVFVEGTARSFSSGAFGSVPNGSPAVGSLTLTSTYTGLNLGVSLTY